MTCKITEKARFSLALYTYLQPHRIHIRYGETTVLRRNVNIRLNIHCYCNVYTTSDPNSIYTSVTPEKATETSTKPCNLLNFSLYVDRPHVFVLSKLYTHLNLHSYTFQVVLISHPAS